MADPLATATESIRTLVSRRINPMPLLQATFMVVEVMSTEDAKQVLAQLLRQRYLAQTDADMAQMLAARLGVGVQWSHATFKGDGEWVEGRGNINGD